MDVAGALLTLLVVLFVVAVAVVAVRTTRAVKRGVERTVADTRKAVEETSLKARSAVQPGAAGTIAGIRLGLRSSIDSTRRELERAAGSDPGLSEAVNLLDRLHEYARGLDGELKHLEREPDKARVAERLPDARARAERIRHSADSLRWAAQDRAQHAAAEGGLEDLSTQIDIETSALRHWTPASDDGGAKAAGGAGPDAAGAGPESAGAGPDAGSRPAISASQKGQDAFQALLTKIEKLRRPEST